jgi:hypothetical protein
MRSPPLEVGYTRTQRQHTTVVCGGGGLNQYQPTGADGPQRRLCGVFLAFFPVGRSSAGALGSSSISRQNITVFLCERNTRMNRAEIGGKALEYEVRGAGEPVVLVHGSHIADAFAPPLNQSTGDWYTHAAIFGCSRQQFSRPHRRAPAYSRALRACTARGHSPGDAPQHRLSDPGGVDAYDCGCTGHAHRQRHARWGCRADHKLATRAG